MAGNEEYGVDLDALDEVITSLNQVLRDMGGPKSKAQGGTYLPAGALGSGFLEKDELYQEHAKMKGYIEDQIIAQIEDMIDDFGKKSKKTKEAYEEAEHKNKIKM